MPPTKEQKEAKEAADKIVADANGAADKIVADATTESKRIVSEVKEQAKDILFAAKSEAEKLIASATPAPPEIIRGYKNTRRGNFELDLHVWKPGETKPAPDEIKDDKKFLHAVSLGILKKV